MFFIRQDRQHIEFLRRLAAQLDEALKPRVYPSMHDEMTAQCLAKKTSLTVSFTNEEPRDAFHAV